MAIVYVKMDGDVVDLTGLGEAEKTHFEKCLAAYQAGAAWPAFMNLVRTYENPLLQETGGMITEAVWRHPLFQAIRDMEDRLGIKQGFMASQADPDRPMFSDAWIGTTAAAKRKGVSLPSLHDAIKRGDVIARRIKPDGARLEVNVASLDRWTVDAQRQKSGRGIATKK